MITPPIDWTRTVADNVLVVKPRDGGGRIRFYERLPVTRFERVVEHLIAIDPGFVPRVRGDVQRLVTAEGEYGAWTTLAGEQSGAPAHRYIGAVITDDFVAAIDGLSWRPEVEPSFTSTARELLVGARFGLGVRRRRFLYRRPRGWQPLRNGLLATWYPIDYPNHRALIFAHPAEPSREPAQLVRDDFIAEEERRGFIRSAPATDS